MANASLTANAPTLSSLLGDLTAYKYNPGLIHQKICDHLSDITAGAIELVDPTNPFVFLLEAACVNTATLLEEHRLMTRDLYPALATTQESLYRHMTQWDYLDRFSVPAKANFYFYLELNSLMAALQPVPGTNYAKVTIPRNTEVSVAGYTFSLQYPIDIVRYDSGVVLVRYDTTISSPLQSLSTNIIDYRLRQDASGLTWLVFQIPLTQFMVLSAQYPVQKSIPFIESVQTTQNYYAARVYYRNDATSDWTEIATTHTDQVYDPYKPTAVLTVYNDRVDVFIPPVYILNGYITGSVRVDVYQTHGHIDVNFANYDLKAFSIKLLALDETRDVTIYTNAFSNVSYFAYTDEIVSDGKDPVDFMTLREAVIQNSVGDRQLPITQSQLDYAVSRAGFSITKNIDTVTNRVFIASRDIPQSTDRYPITPLTVTNATLAASLTDLTYYPSTYDNRATFNQVTLSSNSVFELKGATLSLLTQQALDTFNALPLSEKLQNINSRTLLANPYYYVYDVANGGLDLRAYDLDHPKASTIAFIEQNPTLQLIVNTAACQINKTPNGYELLLTTKSGANYQSLNNANVGIQLLYTPPGESQNAYLQGELVAVLSNKERLWRFNIETNYALDANHQLYLTNFAFRTDPSLVTPCALTQDFTILYYTDVDVVGYNPMAADTLLGTFLSGPSTKVITQESITLQFGAALEGLWRPITSSLQDDYKRYPHDVIMTYDDDVYEIDPDTGTLFVLTDNCQIDVHLLHRKGEPVYDQEGNLVYKHRAGDVMLDKDGNPMKLDAVDIVRYAELLLVDYKYLLATRSDFTKYYTQTIETLRSWITDDIRSISQSLLEQTRLYYRATSRIDSVLVTLPDGTRQYIDTEQSLKVTYYVTDRVYNDASLRETLTYNTIELLSTLLSSQTVSKSELITQLSNTFSEFVESVALSGLGAPYELDYIALESNASGLNLRKRLSQTSDGYLVVEEDVDVLFVNITTSS